MGDTLKFQGRKIKVLNFGDESRICIIFQGWKEDYF